MPIVAQISDLHVVEPGELAYGAVDTITCAANAVRRLNSIGGIDCAIITGDLVQHGAGAEYTVLRSLLSELRVPYYLLPGNHDDARELRGAFPEHVYLGTDGRINYHIRPGLDICAIDTTRPGHEGGEVTTDTLEWLDVQLERCTGSILLAMHHPPVASGTILDDEALIGSAGLEALLFRHAKVSCIVAGHYHRTQMSTFGGSPVAVCPSTAHQLRWVSELAHGLTFEHAPPSFLIHQSAGGRAITSVVPIASAEALSTQ